MHRLWLFASGWIRYYCVNGSIFQLDFQRKSFSRVVNQYLVTYLHLNQKTSPLLLPSKLMHKKMEEKTPLGCFASLVHMSVGFSVHVQISRLAQKSNKTFFCHMKIRILLDASARIGLAWYSCCRPAFALWFSMQFIGLFFVYLHCWKFWSEFQMLTKKNSI